MARSRNGKSSSGSKPVIGLGRRAGPSLLVGAKLGRSFSGAPRSRCPEIAANQPVGVERVEPKEVDVHVDAGGHRQHTSTRARRCRCVPGRRRDS